MTMGNNGLTTGNHGMTIDAHAHLDQVEAFGWDATPARLLRWMDDADIDKAVVTTYADEPGPVDGLERLQGYVSAHPDRFIGFPRIDPRYGEEAIEAFRRGIEEYGMRGLKLHPVSNLSHPCAEHTLELLDVAAALDVPVLLHSGDWNYCLPRQIGRAAGLTDATLMMGHMGGFFNAADVADVAERHANVVLETSAFPYPRYVQDAVDRLGADRVVFGSDQPAANPHVELAKLRVLELDQRQRERILHGNITRLLGLDER